MPKQLLLWAAGFVLVLVLGFFASRNRTVSPQLGKSGCEVLKNFNQRHPFASIEKTNRLEDGAIFETTEKVFEVLKPFDLPFEWRIQKGKIAGLEGKPMGEKNGVYLRLGRPLGINKAASCGQAVNFYWLEKTPILLPEEEGTCPDRDAVVLHESIHALGFAGHETDMSKRTILHAYDGNWPSLREWKYPRTDQVLKDAIRLLYAHPPGTPFEKVCPYK